MSAKASLGIDIPVNDEGIQKFIDGLTKLCELGGVTLPSKFAEGSNKIVTEFGKIAAKAEQTARETAAKAELIEKASAAKINELKTAAGLKEESRQKTAADKRAQQTQAKAAKEAQAQSAHESRAQSAHESRAQSAQARQSAREAAQNAKSEEGNKRKAAAAGNADKAIQAATERRIKFEEQAESQKYEQAKEKYKELVTAHQNMSTAMQEAATKEDKAELASKLAELKAEKQAYADNIRERPETKKGESSDVGMHGTKREGGGEGALLGIAGLGAGVELYKVATEKAKEYNDAAAQLHATTGLQMEDAEKLGKAYNKTGEETAQVMSLVKVKTGAVGPELEEQTKAVMAYAIANNKSAEAVSKKMETEAGRAKIFADAKMNEAIAQEKANDPAMKAQFIQAQLMSTVGKLASVVVGALAPALNGLMPILDAIGGLVGGVVQPLMASLAPVMEKISGLFAKLAPIITELIGGALTALSPILDVLSDTMGALLDPIMDIVKTVAGALTPILKSLAPLIKSLASIFADQFTAQLQILLPVISALLPPLMDLLVPVLQLLISIITPLAQLLAGALSLAIKGVTSVLLFIVDKGIKPLVGWLTGNLKVAIDDTIGYITKAVAAITSVVSSVTSFLGLGDKAAAGAKDATAKAGAAAQTEAARQAEIAKGAEEKRSRLELTAKLAHGKITAAEEAQLREIAQDEQDDAMLAKLDKFDEKKAKKGASNAKKEAKDAIAMAKQAADDVLAAANDTLVVKGEKDKKLKQDELQNTVTHNQTLLAIMQGMTAKTKDEQEKKNAVILHAQAELQKSQTELFEATKENAVDEVKKQSDATISALDSRALRENLSEKQTAEAKFIITQKSLQDELTLRASYGENVDKLQEQIDNNQLKHDSDLAANRKKLQEEIDSDALAQKKAHLEKTIAMLQSQGVSTAGLEKELVTTEKQEEDARYAKELESRKDDLADAVKGAALAEQLAKQHQTNLTAIDLTEAEKRKKTMLDEANYFMGPVMSGMQKGFALMFAGINKMTQHWTESKNAAVSVFGTIASGFIQMIEQMIEKLVAAAAVYEAINIATGGGASAIMGTFSIAKSIGLADGGVMTRATTIGTGVMTHPTYLASGGVMPIIGGEAGDEGVLPLQNPKYPGLSEMASGGLVARLDKLNDTTAQVHAAILNTPPVLPIGPSFLRTTNQAQFRVSQTTRN